MKLLVVEVDAPLQAASGGSGPSKAVVWDAPLDRHVGLVFQQTPKA